MPKPKKTDKVEEMVVPQGKPFMTEVIKLLSQLSNIKPDSNANSDKFVADAYKWDAAEALCKKKSDQAWATLESHNIIPEDGERRALGPGEHLLSESKLFVVQAKISQPVKRFSADALADEMVKQFKCSRSDALLMIERAKKPSNSTVTLSVLER